ncbi:hypothetical protein [Streptosporangium sp. NPDC051022]|uniref:nSTAND1 domain-containing NTPase n=1 Tax=Streptosporangium sp. NPDC051022 TaxID=3155752 RepID=UPI003448C8EA
MLVGPMNRQELREAIVKPATAAGLIMERAVTMRVVEDTGALQRDRARGRDDPMVRRDERMPGPACMVGVSGRDPGATHRTAGRSSPAGLLD